MSSPEGNLFSPLQYFYSLEKFGNALARRGGETGFLLCGLRQEDIREKELREVCYEMELFIKYVDWVRYIHIMCCRNIEQSFCTQLCINIETRPVIPLIKMKALKESDVPPTPCYANRSALLN